ncbi:MAG TPA: hypothetical protein VEF04_04870 [Blastocatellia bacterium]|nr:hypothetical protein [Blastocatellia bacterium]
MKKLFVLFALILLAQIGQAQSTTTNLSITKPATGQAQPVTTIATAIDYLDTAIAGRLTKSITSADVTLTTIEARNSVIELSGTLTGNRNLIVPAKAKLYVIQNSTSGAHTVTVKTSGGTGVAVQQGYTSVVRCDGTNVVFAIGKGSGTSNYLREDGTWATPPGAGGGDSTRKAAYGSRPAVSNDGDIFFPTDGYAIDRDNGTTYDPWGPLFALTRPPALAGFTAVNQGSATAAESRGAIELVAPTSGTDNLRIWKKSAPATPYTITAAFMPTLIGSNYVRCGLLWRESSTGKVVSHDITYGGGWQWGVTKWTDATTYSADYRLIPAMVSHIIWLRINDDGSNRKCSVSFDGRNFVEIHSVGRTDFITANEVGFEINVNNSTYAAAVTLLSWKEE